MAILSSSNLDGRYNATATEREASQALMPVTYIQLASETLDLVHWLSLRGPCPVHHRILDSKLVFKARCIRARCTYVEVKVQI